MPDSAIPREQNVSADETKAALDGRDQLPLACRRARDGLPCHCRRLVGTAAGRAYAAARRAADGKRAENINLLIDPTLVGLIVAAPHFPLWLTIALAPGAAITSTICAGIRGLARSAAAESAGAMAGETSGIRTRPHLTAGRTTSPAVANWSNSKKYWPDH